MPIKKVEYGTAKTGEKVYCYTLSNDNGMSAEILTYGAIVKCLTVKDKNGDGVDVVLGRDTLEDYFDNDGYLGAVIGRHANRIADAEFALNGITYNVGKNEKNNSLHGGFCGFDKKVWKDNAKDGDEPSLELKLFSPDGEEGFPGNLYVTVTYTISADNTMRIEYKAVSDKDTVVNMTNHSYFNLAGYNSGSIYNQYLEIAASFYTPNDDECMPTGEVLKVDNTPFDFRVSKPIGQDIRSDFEQTKKFGGYDHNFVIDGRGMRFAAEAVCPDNGIRMTMYTSHPSMQLYTANALNEGIYKNGSQCGVHSAFCLESQCFPNAMRFAHYPDPVLKADEEYNYKTEYRFDIVNV